MEIVKEFLTWSGPLGLGWPVAGYLLHQLLRKERAMHKLYAANTEAIQGFREVIAELKVLLQERLPRRGG